MSENEGLELSNFSLNSQKGSVSSSASSAPLIKIMPCKTNRGKIRCEIQQKISESVEKNLCRRVRLGQACRDGQKDIVAKLLRSNLTSINTVDDDGMAAIHYAARSNHVEILRMLLRAGADIEVKGSEKIQKITPLICAAKFNAIESCRVLIREGANISVQNCYGQTALHHAVRRKNHKIVELILTEGSLDVNVVDVDKTTALHLAAQVGDKLSAELLLFHEIDFMAVDNDGFTAFHLAAREGNVDVLQTLLDTARNFKMDTKSILDTTDNYSNTCLHLAVKNGRCPTTKLCLEYAASSCVWDCSLQTPLHLASVSGDLFVLYMLFDGKDIDIHSEDGDGMTAILRASLEGHSKVVAYLLDKGAQLNATPGTGSPSPLMCAVKRNQHKTVKFLLSRGALIDQIDTQWRNCLHIAAACSDPETLQILLENGAKSLVTNRDSYGKTPLHYAALRCSHVSKIVSLLTEAGGQLMACDNNEQIPLHYAAQAGIVPSARVLVELAPDSINQPDTRSMTPLHHAASNGRWEACTLLLNHKADVDYRDDLRLTPLFHAVFNGCTRTCKVLLESGADINAHDKKRKTPLLFAAWEGKLDAFKTLLEFDADISFVCTAGWNALDAALHGDQRNICREIIKHARWRDVMANLKYNNVSAMKRLIEKFPFLAKLVMDKCITESTNVDSDKNYSIEYDYQYLCPKPHEETDSDGKRYFGPKVMLDNQRENLLRHPLTKSLMRTKWRSVGVNFFYLGAMIYALFVACFSHYMYCMHSFDCKYRMKTCTYPVPDNCTGRIIHISEICLVIFAVVNLLYECYQLYTERCKYFELTNVLQVSTFVCALIAVYRVNGDITVKHSENSWNAGVIGVMLSYLTILQYIQCLVYAGIYVTMLFEVLRSLLKVLAMFSVLMFGFAIVFVLVLDDKPPFDEFWPALMKVASMTIGELEYSSYFVNEPKLHRYSLALFVFLVFSLLMPIALMNLLIGLAVGDIDSVQNHAELKMMTVEIESVFEFEDKIPMVFRRRMHKSELVLFPNRSYGFANIKKYIGVISNIRELMATRMNDDHDHDTTRDEIISAFQSNLDVHGDRINCILSELQSQRQLLESIVVTFNNKDKKRTEDNEEQEQERPSVLSSDSILLKL